MIWPKNLKEVRYRTCQLRSAAVAARWEVGMILGRLTERHARRLADLAPVSAVTPASHEFSALYRSLRFGELGERESDDYFSLGLVSIAFRSILFCLLRSLALSGGKPPRCSLFEVIAVSRESARGAFRVLEAQQRFGARCRRLESREGN